MGRLLVAMGGLPPPPLYGLPGLGDLLPQPTGCLRPQNYALAVGLDGGAGE